MVGELDRVDLNLMEVLGINWVVTENGGLILPDFERLEKHEWDNNGIPFYIFQRENVVRPHAIFWDYKTTEHSNFQETGGIGTSAWDEFFEYLEHENYYRVALVEGLEADAADADENRERISSITNATWVSPYEMRASVRVSGDAVFMIRDQYYPGWEVTIDGKKSDLLRVNYVFKGVMVQHGQHDIVFKYKPRYLLIGWAVSILTLVFIVWVLNRTRLRSRSSKLTAG